jgi:Protein of unknown function (DUF2946)
MDDIVLQAMAKWPNVPAVHGWLALDRRGNWLIKGETIGNPQVNAFISRNYTHDEHGCWYFQNGPQRVFVALAYLPYVYDVPEHARPPTRAALATHTGAAVREVRGAWIDDGGTLLLATEHGAGHVHDQALDLLLPCFVDETGRATDEDTLEARFDAFAAGQPAALWFQYGTARVKIEPLRAADAPRRFGFEPNPQESPST